MKQIILLLTVATLIGHSLAQGCAANGEYCLTHSDCCSGSCLSFSYKCVPTPPGPIIGSTRVPVTVDTGNRFGGSNGDGGASITQKTCAANGEYCLTGAECCSMSCLSFSYKCVTNYGLATQMTQSGIPVQLPAVGSSGNNAIETANRFGASGKQCTANGLYCYHNNECCSGSCYKSFCATEIRLGVPESELTRPSVANGPYVQVNSLDDLITRFGGGSSPGVADSAASASHQRNHHHHTHVGSRSTAARQCIVVGEGCSRHEDCCSRKCLTYIRKCVT